MPATTPNHVGGSMRFCVGIAAGSATARSMTWQKMMGGGKSVSEQFRSLYSVIPASVRDDKTLRPNAKLLYGELSALTQAEGYCWASNAYLADVFDLAPKTIEQLIKQLCDGGHIRREVEVDDQTREVLSRKIWICGPAGLSVPPPLKNKGRSPQKCGDPPLKNGGGNINNIILNTKDTPLPPKGEKREPEWKTKRFEQFWAFYCKHGRGEKKLAAIRTWDKLKPSDELIDTMARALNTQIRGEQWQRGVGIPYASSWINGRRWEDDLTPAKAVDEPATVAPRLPSKTAIINGEEVNVYD